MFRLSFIVHMWTGSSVGYLTSSSRRAVPKEVLRLLIKYFFDMFGVIVSSFRITLIVCI